jgi:RNA polymerase sigma factor (TIGR02999 family)
MLHVTRILSQIEHGDPSAADQLLPIVYDELRKLAAAKLAQERPGQTLQATGLVHEAYIRLVNVEGAQHWDSRGHFFAAAAEAMRRILVDKARKKLRPKHGGDKKRVDLDSACALTEDRHEDLLALDEVLTRFAALDPLKADLVKLRFFAGMTVSEAAEALGISVATAERYWTYARVWLHCELVGSTAEEETRKNSSIG